MVVRMAEDPKKEEAKQKLRFFKNGKDKAEGEAPEPEGSAPQAVATEETPKEKETADAPPAAEKPEARAEEPPADDSELESDEAPAGETPQEGTHKPRRRERVQAQESEPEEKVTLMSHLLPSLTLGFRTLVILAIITADAFAAYMLTTKVIAPKLIETKIVDLRSEIAELPPDGGVLPAAKPPKPTVGSESVGSMFQIKDIVVNPSGTNGTRYLCTTVALEITNPLVEKEANAREAQVRDLLIEILGRRTVTELSSLEMRDYIREEIETSVNTLLTSGDIDGVYFSNFVLQ
jgi:flagellar FliL protein